MKGILTPSVRANLTASAGRLGLVGEKVPCTTAGPRWPAV